MFINLKLPFGLLERHFVLTRKDIAIAEMEVASPYHAVWGPAARAEIEQLHPSPSISQWEKCFQHWTSCLKPDTLVFVFTVSSGAWRTAIIKSLEEVVFQQTHSQALNVKI